MKARAEFDEQYLSRMGFRYDLRVMLKTVWTVLSQKGAC